MTPERQAGLTLIELLVSVVILTIISGAITEAVIIGLRTSNNTDQRLAESTDAQLISTWFFSDVQSAQTVTTTGTSSCAPNSLLELTWTDAGESNIASYAYQPGSHQLQRVHCTTDSLTTTPQDQQTLARSLSSTSPTASCQTACATLPVVVTMHVTEASGYAYDLTASTRTTP